MPTLSNLLGTQYQGIQGIQGVQGIQGAQGLNGPTNVGLTANIKSAPYTLAIGDVGEFVGISTGGIIIPSNTFSAGDCFTIYNSSGIAQSITQGTGTNLYIAGTASTGNVSMAGTSVLTVLCVSSNTFVVAGAGAQSLLQSGEPPGEQTQYISILQNPLSGTGPNYAVNSDPDASSLVLALPFVSGGRDSGFGDYSGDIRGTTNRTVSVTDSTSLDTSNSKFYGSCFDTSCKMTVDMSTYATLSGEFCWEYWVRATAFGTFDFFLGKASTDNGKGQGVKFAFGNGSGPYMAYAVNDTNIPTTIINASAETSFSTNTWYHLAYTRDSSNVVRLFVNGTPVKSVTDSTSIPASTAFAINNPVYAYSGQIQDMRLYVGSKKYANSGFTV